MVWWHTPLLPIAVSHQQRQTVYSTAFRRPRRPHHWAAAPLHQKFLRYHRYLKHLIWIYLFLAIYFKGIVDVIITVVALMEMEFHLLNLLTHYILLFILSFLLKAPIFQVWNLILRFVSSGLSIASSFRQGSNRLGHSIQHQLSSTIHFY